MEKNENMESRAKEAIKNQQANQQSGPPDSKQQMQVTPEMIKNAQNIKCECGGMIFSEKLIFKSLSSILSPSGKQETIPMPVIVCEKCGKVPNVMDPQNVVPQSLKAEKKEADK